MSMTTTEQEATRNLADLQRLPEPDGAPHDDDPGCGTTGVAGIVNPDVASEVDELPEPPPARTPAERAS